MRNRLVAADLIPNLSRRIPDAGLLVDVDMLGGATKESRQDLYRRVWEWLDENSRTAVSADIQDLTRERSKNLHLVIPLNPLARPYLLTEDPRGWGTRIDDRVIASDDPRGLEVKRLNSANTEAPLGAWAMSERHKIMAWRKQAAVNERAAQPLWNEITERFKALVTDMRLKRSRDPAARPPRQRSVAPAR